MGGFSVFTMKGTRSTVLWVSAAAAVVGLLIAVRMYTSSTSASHSLIADSDLTTKLASFKNGIERQKELRQEYLKVLTSELDALQDQQVNDVESLLRNAQSGTLQLSTSTATSTVTAPVSAKVTAQPVTAQPRQEAVGATAEFPNPIRQGKSTGPETVIGFAAYDKPIPHLLTSFVSPLREAGFKGQIILGVRREILGSPSEMEIINKYDVTLYAIDLCPCDLPWMSAAKTAAAMKTGLSDSERIRAVCVQKYPQLKMEWARFQLGVDWLLECKACTSWALITDFRDVMFQTADPFEGMDRITENGKYDLVLTEEWAGEPHGITNEHWFTWASLHACYGPVEGEKIVKPYKQKPVTCSGTVLGSPTGLKRFAKVITDEFYKLLQMGEKCVTPHVVDQAIHIQMYYQGKYGPGATAHKFMDGPVGTVGGACANATHHSLTDVLKLDKHGFVLNSDGKRMPIVHQYDRCHENLGHFRNVGDFIRKLKKN